MDIICPICAEPWEIDTLHDYAEEQDQTFAQVSKAFRTKGCGKAFDAWGITTCKADDRAGMRLVLADLLGDDIDGYAALMEDFKI